jgi:hypothetical protein
MAELAAAGSGRFAYDLPRRDLRIGVCSSTVDGLSSARGTNGHKNAQKN